MKRLIYIAAILVVTSACSSDVTIDEAGTETSAETAVVVPNSILTMEVDGMVCEMGCGGTLRKELKAIGGVSSVEFDFEDERATNVATISFDNNIITVEEMIKAVSSASDGQFTVGETSTKKLETTSSAVESSSSSEKSNVEVVTTTTEMPNLLDLISGLLN